MLLKVSSHSECYPTDSKIVNKFKAFHDMFHKSLPLTRISASEILSIRLVFFHLVVAVVHSHYIDEHIKVSDWPTVARVDWKYTFLLCLDVYMTMFTLAVHNRY